ncbi:MAG: cysteine desulfurase NifS [Clostridia bacterium]|nr:cysteine desulfurase NifS [Clostridia bacterium]
MKVYLDHSATTPTDSAVLEKMLPYFTDVYGNASSQHTEGQNSAKAVELARMQVAKAIGANASEIYFTSGGTESDNTAIKGVAQSRSDKGKHIITTAIEHHAIIESCKDLEKQGFTVTYLEPDKDGIVSVEKVEEAIREDTILVSVMMANSEIGSIQPIKDIGALCKEKKILFHTDAVQAIGSIRVDVKELNVDLLSMSGHKFYGPKGVGALFIRNGVRIKRFMAGGEQERKMRAGTYNTPGIVGLGEAITLATERVDGYNERLADLRDYMAKRILEEIPFCSINGTMDRSRRLPGNLNVTFDYIEGESILLMLDLAGVYASSGSACSSGSLEPSHVLLAIGVPAERAHGSIRFTLGKSNDKEQIDYSVEKLKETVERLRAISPLFKPIEGDKHNV